MKTHYETNFEVKILREYLRISTEHPNVDYEPCVDFLKQQAVILDLPVAVYYPKKRTKPVIVITWRGRNPKLPTVMFNSHMDVSPVFPNEWNYPPFGAEIDVNGNIYACGIQDAKATGMQYLAAIRALKKEGFQNERTAHISFMPGNILGGGFSGSKVPNEEIGGAEGMKTFVHTNAFRNLNIGFALDKGSPSHDQVIPVFYGQRLRYEVTFKIRGATGDASLMPKHTAGEKFQLLLQKLMDIRRENAEKLKSNKKLKLGDIISVNLTKTNTTAFATNLPQAIEATFDIHLNMNTDPQRFGLQLQQYLGEIGGGIEMSIADKDFKRGITVLNDANIYWVAFKEALEEVNVSFDLQLLPGNTDMRFLRDETVKVPALNFSPMQETPKLAHDHNEYLHAETYLRGIEIYTAVMRALLNAGTARVEEPEAVLQEEPTE